MEQRLIEEGKKLLPKINDEKASFNENELSVIKALYEKCANTRVISMMGCGGRLCPEYRLTVGNYLRSLPDIDFTDPVKTELPPQQPVTDERSKLMLEAISLASKKGIKKPNNRLGIEKLKLFIKQNS